MKHTISKIHRVKQLTKCVALGLLLAPAVVNGAILYEEGFTGSGASLVGQSPAITTGSSVWIGDSLLDNGVWGPDTIGEAAYAAVWLPIDLQPEKRYTITLDVNIPLTVDGNWTALGFTKWDPPLGTGFNVHPDKASCWLLARERGAVGSYPGPSVDNAAWTKPESFYTAGDNTVMKIVLETGASVTLTEVSMYVNDTQLNLDETSTNLSRTGVDASGFAYVGIGRSSMAHTMNRFTVEVSENEGDGTWAGYPILDAAGTVDTGEWMGYVNVANRPYIWSYGLSTYLYIDEAAVQPGGGWAYIFN